MVFCAFINLIALTEGDLVLFLSRRDDLLCTAITLFYIVAIFVFPVYVAVSIFRNFKMLGKPHVEDKIGIFYEEINIKTKI